MVENYSISKAICWDALKLRKTLCIWKYVWNGFHPNNLGGAKVKLQTVIVGPKDRGKNSDSVEYVWCAIDLPKG